jgi:hypothetical protein
MMYGMFLKWKVFQESEMDRKWRFTQIQVCFKYPRSVGSKLCGVNFNIDVMYVEIGNSWKNRLYQVNNTCEPRV